VVVVGGWNYEDIFLFTDSLPDPGAALGRRGAVDDRLAKRPHRRDFQGNPRPAGALYKPGDSLNNHGGSEPIPTMRVTPARFAPAPKLVDEGARSEDEKGRPPETAAYPHAVRLLCTGFPLPPPSLPRHSRGVASLL
jgi:hypothetical protein